MHLEYYIVYNLHFTAGFYLYFFGKEILVLYKIILIKKIIKFIYHSMLLNTYL